jgi:hypothetical protein
MPRSLLASAIVLALAPAQVFAAEKPFPDIKANNWAYASMAQIKKDKLWYRIADGVPKRKVATRRDIAVKTIYLALDSQGNIEGFRRTTAMLAKRPDNASSRKWAQQYRASFPKKKLMYQNYLKSIARLWNHFKPEIRVVAKALNVDPKVVSQNLALQKMTVDSMRLPR